MCLVGNRFRVIYLGNKKSCAVLEVAVNGIILTIGDDEEEDFE